MMDQTRVEMLAHAEEEFPRESCGLILNINGRERYQRCKNLAAGSDHFIMDTWDNVLAEDRGEAIAVVHSHPLTDAKPSQADLVGCERSGLPWYITSWPKAEIERLDPSGYEAPLTGRAFAYGVLDCFELWRDYYLRELNIKVPERPIDALNPNWWKRGPKGEAPLDLYMDGYEAGGFVKVSEGDLRKHDVLLIQLSSDVANHCAIYLGDNMMLHHVWGRLSCREPWGGYWLKHTRACLRHSTLMED